MSLLARLFPREQRSTGDGPEARYLSKSVFVPPPYDGIVGDLVGEVRAMQSMAVFACVRILADTIASMPWYVYRRDKNNIPQRIYPTPGVIQQPCVDMDLFQWKWMVVATLALRGNSFHLVVGRDSTGAPSGLMPIHPDLVFLERRVNVLEWYNPIYRVLGERVPREDIIHIRRFTLPGEPLGLSPIHQAARAIGINLAADEYGYRYFKDSANPSGKLKTDQTLTDEEVEQVQAQWMNSHSGRRFPAVLTGGFDWSPISITPEESQFLATRNYQVSDIARFYGVPPHLIGDQEKATSWGTGIESMNLGFHTYTLMGWTTNIESAISNFLPRGQAVKFDTSSLIRGDFKSQIDALNVARSAGIYSANEARGRLELPPIPDGDGYLQPANMEPLGFVPEVTPVPKMVPEGAPSGGSTPAPAAPAKAPAKAPASGQEPEPSGIGNSRGFFTPSTPQARLVDGRPEYFDPRTGETVNMQEENR